MRFRSFLAAALLATGSAAAASYGPQLEGFDYPHKVESFTFESQRQSLTMAYMDVAPTGAPNGRIAVLLHGKNFCGATWEATIATLASAGWRVIVPDQIGFCKSSKPAAYQFTFAQLAANTNALLTSLGIEAPVLIGHSMGGMLATRYTLQYPASVQQLVLVNMIGLEDWQGAGVPYQPLDAGYANELKTTAETIKAYQLKFYYDGQWNDAYQRWVDMLAGMYAGPGREAVAWNQAQTSDMVFTQPVVHEFDRIAVPTVIINGQKDRTAPGAARAPAELAAKLGDYPALGRAAAARIPGAKLITFDDLGHSPQVEAPERFHEALLGALAD